MDRRVGFWTAVVAIAAVGGIVGWRIVKRAIARHHPGATLVLAVDAAHPYDTRLGPQAARRRTLEVLRGRLEKVAPLALLRADGDRVEVVLAHGDPVDRVAAILTRSGRLEFKVVDDGSDYMKQLAGAVANEHPGDVELGHDGWTERSSGAMHSDVYLHASTRDKLIGAIRSVVATNPVPAEHELAVEHRSNGEDAGDQWRSYYLFSATDVDGDRISDAEVDWDAQTGRPEVALTFDAEGAKAFEALSARTIGRKLAIVLESRIQSAPVVESKISGGHARITMGGFTDPFQLQTEAKDLVAVLRVGGLAAPVTLVETRAPPAR